ncbi:cupin domain-containing protein [Pseudomonadales bacterium]|nr:cupin domain-containing protein [Pseudomonadales bacterium]
MSNSMDQGSSSILGEIAAEDFLQHYWQKQPLLIRDALPDYESPVSPDELAGLSLESEVESRIVEENGADGPWSVRHGPFEEEDYQGMPEKDWTLLVQGVDLWVPQVKELLKQFDFLPAWRLDDIMISYACEGGSVGPHFDQYDVFLLQVEGQRCWQVGEECGTGTPLLEGTELRIIADFQPVQEWLLNPGDMLYLPPGVGHWGVAESECLTFSIGFRSPTLADMLGDLAVEMITQGHTEHYRDPELTPAMASQEIHPAFIDQAKKQLFDLLNDDELIEDWFARFMTAPKYPELEEQTEEQRHASIRGRRYFNGDAVD